MPSVATRTIEVVTVLGIGEFRDLAAQYGVEVKDRGKPNTSKLAAAMTAAKGIPVEIDYQPVKAAVKPKSTARTFADVSYRKLDKRGKPYGEVVFVGTVEVPVELVRDVGVDANGNVGLPPGPGRISGTNWALALNAWLVGLNDGKPVQVQPGWSCPSTVETDASAARTRALATTAVELDESESEFEGVDVETADAESVDA